MTRSKPRQRAEDHSDGYIRTFSGGVFYPFAPRESDISIWDIAHALAAQCRFTGHSRYFYSVAQHCVLVSYLVDDPEHALQGLLHDASEAYLCDIATPVKRSPEFAAYREAENRIQRLIYRKFGVPEIEHPAVKKADFDALSIEGQHLMPYAFTEEDITPTRLSAQLTAWNPDKAEQCFLERFWELRDTKESAELE